MYSALAAMAVLAVRVKPPDKLPNLVMILPDDLGYFGAHPAFLSPARPFCLSR